MSARRRAALPKKGQPIPFWPTDLPIPYRLADEPTTGVRRRVIAEQPPRAARRSA